MAQKKAEILKKLEEEGVLQMNKEISFPSVPQKIAIISSDSAAGYQDFINQLTNNSSNYRFYTKLFPAVMQGLKAEDSIINSLEKIYTHEDFFDLVVIIRGGGSQSDLSCFNSYLLSANIAQFPLPILTGIGHDKDESIVDLVAHKKLKTPTAVAEFLIEKVSEFENNLVFLKENILNIVTTNIQYEKTKLTHFYAIMIPAIKNNIEKSNFQLDFLIEKLKNRIKQLIKQESVFLINLSNSVEKKSTKILFNTSQKIQHFKNKIKNGSSMYIQLQKLFVNNTENNITLLDPKNILKRGYSITYFKGKSIKNTKKINENDEIITKLFSGFVRSKIEEKY
jgi:exodeoxyribonuclease VII large subunit